MNSSTCSSFLQTTTVRIDGILRHPHSTTPPAFDVPSKTALTIQGIYTFCCWVPNITPTVLHTLPTLLYLSFVYQSLWCVHGFTCTCYKPQNRNKPPEWIYCTLEASGQKNSISQQPAPTNTLPYSLRWGMNKPQLQQKPPEMPSDAANGLLSWRNSGSTYSHLDIHRFEMTTES